MILGKNKKRKKAQDDSEEGEESGSEAEGSDDERPKKRGRPRVTPRENIKSFTDVEVSHDGVSRLILEIISFLGHIFNDTLARVLFRRYEDS